MGYEILIYGLVFLILLGLSAFFSGSETAFFSLPPSTIEQYSASSISSEQRVARLMGTPRKLLITIVLGNTVVNTTTASLAAILTTQICDAFGFDPQIAIFINVVVVTLVLLITSEIMPKVIAVRNPKSYARITSLPLLAMHRFFKPLTFILAKFTIGVQNISGFSEEKVQVTGEEDVDGFTIKVAEVGQDYGTLEKEEKEMIHSIFEFGDTTVKEVMVPRIDMICFEVNTPLPELLKAVRSKLLSRIPVYEERIDNIIGILYLKDLLPLLNRKRNERFSLKRLSRPPRFVPEQKLIGDLLKEFQRDRIHMALVVDEYGGVSGLVTLEDIIEEIVGEIQDEFDKDVKPLYKKLDDGAFLVDGSMALEDVNDKLRLNLPTEEGVETISGFILTLLGSLPREKETARYNKYHFVVESVSKNRIRKVRIEIKRPEKSNIENGIAKH